MAQRKNETSVAIARPGAGCQPGPHPVLLIQLSFVGSRAIREDNMTNMQDKTGIIEQMLLEGDCD